MSQVIGATILLVVCTLALFVCVWGWYRLLKSMFGEDDNDPGAT